LAGRRLVIAWLSATYAAATKTAKQARRRHNYLIISYLGGRDTKNKWTKHYSRFLGLKKANQ
jgi:hypothetical protein